LGFSAKRQNGKAGLKIEEVSKVIWQKAASPSLSPIAAANEFVLRVRCSEQAHSLAAANTMLNALKRPTSDWPVYVSYK